MGDQFAFVTGGGGGIGARIAHHLASVTKLPVAVADIAGEAAAEVAGSLAADGYASLGLHVDVAAPSAVAEAMSQARSVFGGNLSVLINAAAIVGPPGELQDTTQAVWQQLIDVNLLGTVTACTAAVPHMRGMGRGRIVNFGSIAALMHRPGRGAYGAIKAAVLAFTRSLATEVADEGITVNAVCPGPTVTPMLTAESSQERLERLRLDIPTGRLVDPDEVASMVSYLISDAARNVTGQSFHINGGGLMP